MSSISAQATGAETCAPGRARTDHAPKTVLCGAFWLKSTNTRWPRSSFHQAAVAIARELERRGRGAHLIGVPARLQPHEHVQAAVAGRLGVAGDSGLVEQPPQLVGGQP